MNYLCILQHAVVRSAKHETVYFFNYELGNEYTLQTTGQHQSNHFYVTIYIIKIIKNIARPPKKLLKELIVSVYGIFRFV